jgi:hypothetical protein
VDLSSFGTVSGLPADWVGNVGKISGRLIQGGLWHDRLAQILISLRLGLPSDWPMRLFKPWQHCRKQALGAQEFQTVFGSLWEAH